MFHTTQHGRPLRLRRLGALTAVAIALAACSNDGEAAPTTEAAAATSAATTTGAPTTTTFAPITLAGADDDPAARDAFAAVEAAFEAFSSGDGEAWVDALIQGQSFEDAAAGQFEATRDAWLLSYAAGRGVEETIEVTGCVSHGFGEWPGVYREPFGGGPVPVGYRFVCDAIHTNAFHGLGGVDLEVIYEWVAGDGEILASRVEEDRGEWHRFSDDFTIWLWDAHPDVTVTLAGFSAMPAPEHAAAAIELATLFVEESPDWPDGA